MYITRVFNPPKKLQFYKLRPLLTLPLLSALVCVLYFGYVKYNNYTEDQEQTLAVISNPKIDDIYFLDFRLLSDKLRPKEKYRIAKVVDITGDIVTLIYGGFYYQRENAAINSIKYGQLSYSDYFETKRYDIPLNTIKAMQNNGTIYLAKRPTRKKLYGNLVGPEINSNYSHKYIYGKKENIKGEAFLKEQYSETNFKQAFNYFQQSSSLGYAKGQVNLDEMYINGTHTEIDLNKALHWLKLASLQSSKPAILKYGIICKQVTDCNIYDFYQNLTDAGVNVKVRKLDFELSK